MGIRFYCPNGHKLNVKSYLAGKRGICPDCGAKVLIPDAQVDAGSAAPNVPRMAAPVTSENESDPAATASVPATAQPLASTLPLASTGQVPGADVAIDIAIEQSVETQVENPIDENPEAVWYVRLATGNQYGPAAGDVFRTWIAEGRVTPESLVWCEGWPEWRTASNVFPQLIRH